MPAGPRLWDFLERIHAREASKRALERGVPIPFCQVSGEVSDIDY